MKITVHGELNIYFPFHGKKFCKTMLHGYMEITIHEEKNFAKKGRSGVEKIPFTTLHKHTACTRTRTPEHHRTP